MSQGQTILSKLIREDRVTVRRDGPPDPDGTCVVYWMQRAQRGIDNPALDIAVETANALKKTTVIFFAPIPYYPHANLRHYQFLAEGVQDIAGAAAKRNIGFVLRRHPEHSLVRFCDEVKPALVVGDENPMRQPESWRATATKRLKFPLWTVDADVIVPSKLIPKQYAARFMRARIAEHLERFLVPHKNARAQIAWKSPKGLQVLNPDCGTRGFELIKDWPIDRTVSPVSSFRGGTTEGMRLLTDFVKYGLHGYNLNRNNPELHSTSKLSPYLHFGHISPRTVALAVKNAEAPKADKDAFLDQLITWRELSINFVRTNLDYDNFECGENWAHRTLAEHVKDLRPVVYSERQLENAETGDALWNAAQRQMVNTGYMHNYLRMYWGKKILEWSPSAAQAFDIAVRLNDKYELDGRDPNGYAGIAWSIVGKFDRPWFERPIFGTIRYMSGTSTGKKFDSKKYIAQQERAEDRFGAY
jgi:deoxyribodipyrimidine photo-lyase